MFLWRKFHLMDLSLINFETCWQFSKNNLIFRTTTEDWASHPSMGSWTADPLTVACLASFQAPPAGMSEILNVCQTTNLVGKSFTREFVPASPQINKGVERRTHLKKKQKQKNSFWFGFFRRNVIWPSD